MKATAPMWMWKLALFAFAVPGLLACSVCAMTRTKIRSTMPSTGPSADALLQFVQGLGRCAEGLPAREQSPMHVGRAVACGPLDDDAVAVLRPHQDRARRQVQKAAHCRRHRDLPLRGEFGLDFLHHGMLADYRGNGLGRAGLAEGAAPLDSSACQGPLLTFCKAPEATDPAARSPGSPGMAHFSVRRPVTDAGRTPC